MIHTLMALDKVKSACTITTRPTFKAFVGLLRGQNAPKIGSKCAHFTCLCTPNGLG